MPGKSDTITVWPIYFDSERSRSGGRMVSGQEAIANPTLDDIIAAATKAGYKPEIEREKKHPKDWYDRSGRLLIKKREAKSLVLKKIARGLKKKSKR